MLSKGLLLITFHSSKAMISITAGSVRTPHNWMRVIRDYCLIPIGGSADRLKIQGINEAQKCVIRSWDKSVFSVVK